MKEEVNTPDTRFVYVYAEYGNEEANKQRDWCVTSLARTYPGVPIMSVTLTCPQEHFMIYRTLAWRNVRKEHRGNLIYIDTDILAWRKAPLEDIFAQNFDVALVQGNSKEPYLLMPWCGSFVASRDTPKAQEYFNNAYQAAVRLPQGMLQNGWWVDQLGMQWAAEHTPELKLMEFPQDQFNYLPEGPRGTNAYFIHFKGPRKQYMAQYFRGLMGNDYVV